MKQQRLDIPTARTTMRQLVRESLRDFRYRQAAREERRRATRDGRLLSKAAQIQQQTLFGGR